MNRCEIALSRLALAGDLLYGGEPVSQLQHALQTAFLADTEGASDALIVAALFHDIGHVLQPGSEDATRRGVDLQHEQVGARFLAWCGFPPEVVEPVRLHVDAKRLLAREPAFLATLSEESRRSLVLQGGPLDDDAALAFHRLPFAEAALRLRSWDDRAKEPGLLVPDVACWTPLVCEVLGVGALAATA